MASAQNPHSGVPLALMKSSSASMATLSHTPWWFIRPVSRWPPRGGLNSEFLSPRTPTHGRQGLALSGRFARQFGPRLLIGYSQLTYTCAYTCMHSYIYNLYMHTHIPILYKRVYTYIHCHRPSRYPPPADAPHRLRPEN